VALTRCTTYALTKQFIVSHIFEKFPGLQVEMLGISFARYVREIRRPCGKRRVETINRLNRKKNYTNINFTSGNKDNVSDNHQS